MTLGRQLLPALLIVAAACHKPAPAPVAMDSAALATAHRGVPMLDPEVRLVASIVMAMRDHPEFRDSILPAYHLTKAQFDSMKAEVTADSAKNAMFMKLTAPDTARTPAPVRR